MDGDLLQGNCLTAQQLLGCDAHVRRDSAGQEPPRSAVEA